MAQPVEHDPSPNAWRGYLGIAAITAAILAYAGLTRYALHDSFWIDLVWSEQFSQLLREGQLWPRWLPWSHGGLGAPVFYFYPPLAFHLAGLFALFGAPTYWAVTLAFTTALAGSGVAMRLWLRDLGIGSFVPVWLFMLAPYHLYDYFGRGALAEYCAFALVPLLALGLRRAATGRGPILLAVSYASIILCHLPAALLATLFVAIPYGLVLVTADRRALPALAFGGVAGLLVAGLYLLPMLALQPFAMLGSMISLPMFNANAWSILHPSQWILPDIYPVAAVSGALLFTIVLMLTARRNAWLWAALAVLLVVWGLLPGFWSLPGIANVQFPWRALMFVEFYLMTGIGLAALAPVPLAARLLPLLFGSLVSLTLATSHPIGEVEDLLRRMPDVREYLPPQAPVPSPRPHWRTTMKGRIEGVIGAAAMKDARFYFPSWSVTCQGRDVASWADPRTGTLRWSGRDCVRSIGWTVWEKLGLALSLFGILLLVLAARFRLPSR